MTSVNGWIVIQQRITANTSFALPWANYTAGFGTYNDNFWLGLEKVYQLTANKRYKLRFELLQTNGQWMSAEYDGFSLGGAATYYTIHVSGFTGDTGSCGDVMNTTYSNNQVHNGMKFTTVDQDHDLSSGNCATSRGGGWWYNDCVFLNLNMDVGNGLLKPYVYTGSGSLFEFLTATRMMIKQL